MKGKLQRELTKIWLKDADIEQRFLKATIGWTRYKPLLHYINDRKDYRRIIDKAKEDLRISVDKISTAFWTCDFSCLLNELDKYDKDVEKHYEEYLKVNELWDKLKYKIK